MKTFLIPALLSGSLLWAAPRLCQDARCAGSHAWVSQSQSLLAAEFTRAIHTSNDTTIAVLQIHGMDCAGCASMIHHTLSKMAGVYADEVKYPGNRALVQFDKARIKPPQMIQAIRQLGYTATLISCTEKH
ncbi:heavy-metal-associated domain-containing protein [Thermoflavifilum thermophilum]|uniref:Heavy-metal-associated domain-containing protein n=1 Tax=Thermoflavifilum thermophilum TaxID=1393122 RepID=A0A1I7NDR8_9BACT|nr:heavy metal-associated domain-containing protein [Thermoflavifilum thermophilum]SFV32802.1 Heavy-metal-associated domain-containing protein [Thermoflavifilum thermophilum]